MTRTQSQRIASWIFGSLLLIFLLLVYFIDEGSEKSSIVRYIAAISAGLIGYFITGPLDVMLERKLPAIGNISIRAGTGFAFVVIIWFTWPNAINTPEIQKSPELKQVDFFVRRNGDDAKIETYSLVRNYLEMSVPPIKYLMKNDDFKISARFNQATYWYIIWIDTNGIAQVVANSKQPEMNLIYPNEGFVMADKNDPIGQHLLLILSSSDLIKKFNGIIGNFFDKKEFEAGFNIQLREQRGPGEKRSTDFKPIISILKNIDDNLPKGVEQKMVITIPYSIKNGTQDNIRN